MTTEQLDLFEPGERTDLCQNSDESEPDRAVKGSSGEPLFCKRGRTKKTHSEVTFLNGSDLDRRLTDARRELLRMVKAEITGAVVDPDERNGLQRRVLDLSSERQRRHPPIGGGFVVGKRRRVRSKVARPELANV